MTTSIGYFESVQKNATKRRNYEVTPASSICQLAGARAFPWKIVLSLPNHATRHEVPIIPRSCPLHSFPVSNPKFPSLLSLFSSLYSPRQNSPSSTIRYIRRIPVYFPCISLSLLRSFLLAENRFPEKVLILSNSDSPRLFLFFFQRSSFLALSPSRTLCFQNLEFGLCIFLVGNWKSDLLFIYLFIFLPLWFECLVLMDEVQG